MYWPIVVMGYGCLAAGVVLAAYVYLYLETVDFMSKAGW